MTPWQMQIAMLPVRREAPGAVSEDRSSQARDKAHARARQIKAENRASVISQLRKGEKTRAVIIRDTGLSRTTVSKTLRELKAEGLAERATAYGGHWRLVAP